MCEYCENEDKLPSELEIDDVFIVSSAMYTRVGDGTPWIIPTNFCPNCGRELKRHKSRIS